jgi:hypothetical protein
MPALSLAVAVASGTIRLENWLHPLMKTGRGRLFIRNRRLGRNKEKQDAQRTYAGATPASTANAPARHGCGPSNRSIRKSVDSGGMPKLSTLVQTSSDFNRIYRNVTAA